MTFATLPVWLLALVLATTISAVAYRANALSLSGAMVSTLLGAAVVGLAGWGVATVLVVFFLSSSALSRLPIGVVRTGHHEARTAIQVIANSWVVFLGVITYAATQNSVWIMFSIGAIAAATADTWSSEIGRTSPTRPRNILTRHIVPAGTSGGVTTRGLFAALLGAVLIAATAVIVVNSISASHALLLVLAGFTGAMVDSVLGATIQEQRICRICGEITEHTIHTCGAFTEHYSGMRHVDNNIVNALCILSGALVAGVSGIL